MRTLAISLLLALLVASAVPAPSVSAAPCSDALLQRVSVRTGGASGGFGLAYDLSTDGRFIVMNGDGLTLTDATPGFTDIYLHDRANCVTTLVSVATGGVQANFPSGFAALSGDGRYVAFESSADNLTPGDTNMLPDIFLHDTLLGITTRLSGAVGGADAPRFAANGRYVVFGQLDGVVYRYDLQTSAAAVVSVPTGGAPGGGAAPTEISGDGRYILFNTQFAFVPEDTNGEADGYLRDLLNGTTERVTLGAGGAQLTGGNHAAYALSDDARYIAFLTDANGVVPNDTNGKRDVYVYDRQMQTVELISRRDNGTIGNNGSEQPAMSADGRLVAFYSAASNLISGDTNGKQDVFVHDRHAGHTRLASRTAAGALGNDDSLAPFISADGKTLVYSSVATNLAAGDTPFTLDAFAGDLRLLGGVNLLNNGDFSVETLGNGMGTWGRFGTPTTDAMVYQFNQGVFEFYRATGGTSAVLLQNTGVPVPANTTVSAYMELGNTSTSRMRVLAMLHSQDFSDLQVCVFWLEPGSANGIYFMETYASTAWGGASLSLYASPDRAAGWIQVDNVDLTWNPAGTPDRTLCTEPIAFGNDPLPDSGNLIANGDFSQSVIGGTPVGRWGYFATPDNSFINFRFTNGVFEYYRVTGGQSAVILQNSIVALPPYNAIEVTLLLGNSSAARKRILVMLHDGDFQDLQVCSFWLQPNTPLDFYTMLSWTTKAWAAAHISLYASPDTSTGWIQVDNVVYRHRPALAPIGTECYERGAQPVLDARLALPPLPALLPTSTPNPFLPLPDALPELPLLPAPPAAEPPASAEGTVIE